MSGGSFDYAWLAENDKNVVVSLNLDLFKVHKINCDGWVVPPAIEIALKEIVEKHNDLVDFLSIYLAKR